MDLNSVVLTGSLRRDPITKFSDAGAQQVSFTLEVIETTTAGAPFTLWVPVECYGEAIATAGDLHTGQSVLVAGKLKYTSYTAKDGTKRSTLCVLARLVKPMTVAPEAKA